MRHRIGIASLTGLGNPSPALLNNELTTDTSFNEKIKTLLSAAMPKTRKN